MWRFFFGVPEEELETATAEHLDALVRGGGLAAKLARAEQRFRRKKEQLTAQHEALMAVLKIMKVEVADTSQTLHAMKTPEDDPDCTHQ
jgi:hypothetical protein